MLRVMLRAQRGHTGSAGENHFRRAESQFFRMLVALPRPGATKLDAVEYCFAPRLVAAYDAKRAAFDARYGAKGHQEVLLFHGTPKPAAVENIVTNGFDMKRVGSTSDAGYYGAGAYLSELTSMSMDYAQSCSKMLMCRVLLGKPYMIHLQERDVSRLMGQPCVAGHDSHVLDDAFSEVVIFDSAQILPCYILHLAQPHAMGRAASAAAAGMFMGGAGADEEDEFDAPGADFTASLPPAGGFFGALKAALPSHAADEAAQAAKAEERKRKHEAAKAAEAADLERALKLSVTTASSAAGAARDYEAQLARALAASRATMEEERKRRGR